MFLETIHSEGIAHLSYVVGDTHVAAVIDPRRDCEIYLQLAAQRGVRITHIFETHRNEDYIVGSRQLAERTGAQIHHGRALKFRYGNAAADGSSFNLGKVRLAVLETPGHTPESISIAAYDKNFSNDAAVAVFTGDALFVGDVGRTDFFPAQREQMAAQLYDSIHGRLLPLGDGVRVCPAHGYGSICGNNMAQREFSTLGFERAHNPMLQLNRETFIHRKSTEKHAMPPYFARMEEANQKGEGQHLEHLPYPQPLPVPEFEQAMHSGLIAVDIRSAEAFGAAFIPGSLCLPLELLSGFAGWLLPYDQPIGLIAESNQQVNQAAQQLVRIGYDRLQHTLQGGISAWETAGKAFDRIPGAHAKDVRERLSHPESFTLLDVRSDAEFEQVRLAGALHIYAGELPNHLDKVPRDKPVTTFCSSGTRAMVAASILKKHGFATVDNALGSLSACRAIGCDLLAA